MSRPVAPMLAATVRGLVGDDLPVGIRAWDRSQVGPGSVPERRDGDGPVLVLNNRRALRRLLWRPDELGLARAYVTGDLDVDGDLADGLRRVWAFARERGRVHVSARDRIDAVGTAARLGVFGPPPRPPASEARIHGRLHSRARDQAVIAHHYDLSNDFYALLLDDAMSYSCGYYGPEGTDDVSLDEAQRAKFELVCTKLGLRPGMRMLDVGCGWGSLSIHAARHHGVHVTGITLSREQLDFARKRAADQGVSELVDFRLLDYRDLQDGPYDAAASLEMGEHVGDAQYPAFVATVQRALKPGASFLVQQMSRAAGDSPGGGPFIEAYIAPDMHMRPLGETIGLLEGGGFEVRGVQALREHYVRTGEEWLSRLETRWNAVVALVGEEIARVWRLYLVGGGLAFEEGRMGVDQILVRKPFAPDSPDAVNGFATADFFVAVAASAAAVLVFILATWFVARAVGRFNVIDVAWGLGFVLVAWVTYVLSSGHGDDTRRLVVALLVTVGAGRLAVYIGWRSRGKGEDPRYAEMLEGHADPRGALGIYLTQAVAIWFVSLAVQVAMFETSEPGVLFVVGIVVWAIGFAFESVGDWQLARFRSNPNNKGEVMDRGLWHFTRHPNYFGDATMWWGIWLIAAQQWQGLATVLSPVLMTWTLTRKTGTPTLEKGMADRRPGYREYVARTSSFFPLPPKRVPPEPVTPTQGTA